MSTQSQFPPEASLPEPNLAGLFPGAVVVRERRVPGDAADLLPSEAAFVKNARPKRINEFAAGRWCARSALAQLGQPHVALHPAADRQPNWPPDYVGSITHTTGFCAAAVARRSQIQAIGLDSEVVGAPSADIWATICRDEELTWVTSLPETARPAAVTLLFSAKEAFYKCQYPLVGEWLDFHDLAVQVRDFGRAMGAFAVQSCRDLQIRRLVELPIDGRYVFHEEFVSAGIVVPADANRAQ